MEVVIATVVVMAFWPCQGGHFGAGVGRNDLLRHLGGGSLGLRGVVGSIWYFRSVRGCRGAFFSAAAERAAGARVGRWWR